MTLTFDLVFTYKLDLDIVQVNERAKYLGQEGSNLNVIVRTQETDISDRLLY